MELNFSGLVKEINLITEHPYKALNKQIIFCKEINSTLIDKKNFYNDYIKSKERKQFIKYNKIIYRDFILNRHFSLLFWNIFLDKVENFDL